MTSEPTCGPADHETKAFLERQFGNGSVLFGQKQPKASEQNSLDPDSEPYKVMTEEELEEEAGRKVMLGRAIQNVQLAMQAAGKNLGSVSANAILEMADKGEIEESKAVQSIRTLVAAWRTTR